MLRSCEAKLKFLLRGGRCYHPNVQPYGAPRLVLVDAALCMLAPSVPQDGIDKTGNSVVARADGVFREEFIVPNTI